jgi:hypothetical protein
VAATEPAEEDPAQREQAERLPEGDLAPAGDRRQQPIPEPHHHQAANEDERREAGNRERRKHRNPHPSWSHDPSLSPSMNSS